MSLRSAHRAITLTLFVASLSGGAGCDNDSKPKVTDTATKREKLVEPDKPAQRSLLPVEALLQKLAGPASVLPEPKFQACKGKLCAIVEGQEYSLGPAADRVDDVKKTEGGYSIFYGLSYACYTDQPRRLDIENEELAARYENTLGYRAYEDEKYEVASQSFARALLLDADLELARGNLASALLKLDRPDEAERIFVGEKKELPLDRLLQLFSDQDIAPLLRRPAILEHLPKKPGDAKLTLDDGVFVDFGVAVSKELDLVAVVSTHENWGVASKNHDLEIFEQETGKPVFRHRLVSMLDYVREPKPPARISPERLTAIAGRLEAATAFLQGLGFWTFGDEARHEAVAEPSGKRDTMYLPTEQVGITTDKNTVRTFKKGKLVARHKVDRPIGFPKSATYLPSIKTLVVETHHDEPEGCAVDFDIASAVVVPIELDAGTSSKEN